MSELISSSLLWGMVSLSLAFAHFASGPGAPGDAELRGLPIAHTTGAKCAAAPKRVVSASLLTDELVFDVLPRKRLVALSYAVDWPAATPIAGRVPRDLARTGGGLESLLAPRPDRVLLSDYNHIGVAAQLAAAGVCVHRVRAPRSFLDLAAEWRALGRSLGQPSAVEARVRQMLASLRDIQAGRPPVPDRGAPRALLLQGLTGYADRTLQHDCLRYAGLRNALGELGSEGTPLLNVEHILELNPDVIFVAADTKQPRRARASDLEGGVPWRALEAHRKGLVFAVPGVWMASISHYATLACRAYASVRQELVQ